MKKPVSCLCALFLCLSLCAQEKWDLRRCVDYALSNNISIKQEDIRARLSQITYEQSKLSQYPIVNFNSNLGLSTGRSIDRTTNQFTTNTILYNTFGLQSSADVFNFFSKRNTIEANRFSALSAIASVDKLKDDISLLVAANYLNVLLTKQQVEIARVQMQQTRNQLENTRKLVNAGSVPELNAAQLEAQLAQDSSNLVSIKSNNIQAYYSLKALLALDAATPFEVVTPPVELIPVEPLADLQPEDVFRLALVNFPRQKITGLNLKSAEKNVAAAKGQLYPSIGASGALQSNYSNSKNRVDFLESTINGYYPIGVVKGTNDTVLAPKFQQNLRYFSNPYSTQLKDNLSKGIGLNLSVPIFNSGAARANVERAKLNFRSAQLAQQQDTLSLKQDIYKAYTDAITALEKFNAATKSVETSEIAFGYATKRNTAGLLSTIEYLTTQSNLFSARISRSIAQFDYVFKMKVLEFYKGQGLKL
jgi:outer membrane protein